MGYSSAQAKSFIEYIAPIMQAEAFKRGYKNVSAAIAQAVIEGAAGTSKLAKYHNHWGIKCGNAWKGKSVNMATKEEYQPGVLTNIKDNFRVWDNDVEGVAGYYDFVGSKRYQGQFSTPLKDCTDYKQYAEALKKCGYATSSTYVNTLCSTVQKYGLQKYDSDVVAIVDKTKYYCPNVTYTTQVDLYIRDNADGMKMTFDSISIDGKMHSKCDDQGYAILKKGTRVTCKEVVGLDASVWIRIPSGYICAINGNKIYVS